MNVFQKSLLVFLSTILLLSQMHLSVYAIHCLCTGETHFALSAEKECSSDECKSDVLSCCDNPTEGCTADADELHAEKDCHAPKSAIELGIDLEGAMVNSPISELDKLTKGFDLPLYILFSSLKIPHADQVASAPLDADSEVKPPGFRYLLYGEMLC
nr:hypothetical protein [Saprospiraceae bacterium]